MNMDDELQKIIDKQIREISFTLINSNIVGYLLVAHCIEVANRLDMDSSEYLDGIVKTLNATVLRELNSFMDKHIFQTPTFEMLTNLDVGIDQESYRITVRKSFKNILKEFSDSTHKTLDNLRDG